MKNALYIIAAVIAIIALPAKAAVVVTNITHLEFETVFSTAQSKTVQPSDAVWYAQIQAGGLSDHETEIGGKGSVTDTGETTWVDGSDNSFTLSVSGANYLTLAFLSSAAGDGF
jgi:hypothetical protein